jgi:hypothetical protein
MLKFNNIQGIKDVRMQQRALDGKAKMPVKEEKPKEAKKKPSKMTEADKKRAADKAKQKSIQKKKEESGIQNKMSQAVKIKNAKD